MIRESAVEPPVTKPRQPCPALLTPAPEAAAPAAKKTKRSKARRKASAVAAKPKAARRLADPAPARRAWCASDREPAAQLVENARGDQLHAPCIVSVAAPMSA